MRFQEKQSYEFTDSSQIDYLPVHEIQNKVLVVVSDIGVANFNFNLQEANFTTKVTVMVNYRFRLKLF